eukprot:6198023-Pleurochrysis_carterae.AAC.6
MRTRRAEVLSVCRACSGGRSVRARERACRTMVICVHFPLQTAGHAQDFKPSFEQHAPVNRSQVKAYATPQRQAILESVCITTLLTHDKGRARDEIWASSNSATTLLCDCAPNICTCTLQMLGMQCAFDAVVVSANILIYVQVAANSANCVQRRKETSRCSCGILLQFDSS